MKKFTLLNILFLLLLCGYTAKAQFSESFDGTDTPPGWTVINLGDVNTWLFGPPGDGTTHSGSGDAHISYNFSAAHDDYLITPQISVTADLTDQIRFYARNNGTFYSEKFDVLVSTTGIEATDFTDTLESQIGPPSTWTEYVYALTDYVGQDIYISFHATSLNQLKLHIDDVINEKIPTCPRPLDVSATVTSTTTADLSWTENGDATEWDIIYGIAGFDPATEGTTVGDNNGVPGISLTDLTPETAYEFYVRAICGIDDESILSDMGEFYTGYCVYTGTNTSYYIAGFSTAGGTDNISNLASGDAPSGYADYTDQVVSKFATGIVSFTATFGSGTNGFNIYIDWNGDMIFDDSEKAYTSGGYVSEASGLISVPAGTANGDYRMRIVSNWLNGDPPPCGDNVYGEAEDYTFSVIDPPSCMPPTDPVAISVSFTGAVISWTENGTAIEWEVIYGLAGFDPATEGTSVIDDDGTPGTILTDLTAETNYDFYVRSICSVDDESEISLPGSFYTGYCSSVPTSNDNDGITNVQVGTTNFPGTDLTYLNFAGSPVDLPRGETANVQIAFATGYTYYTNIWVDFNDNMEFESSELVFQGESTNSNPTTLNSSFMVPLDAPLGVHRLRIGTADGGQSTPNPCYNGSYGITVDLDINVTEAPLCISPSELTLDTLTFTSATISWTENGDATTWEITYGEAGFDPLTEGTTIIDNDGTPGTILTDLNPETAYEFYVQAICSVDDQSNLSGPGSFFTGYCQFFGTNTSYYINNFSTTLGVQNISNLLTGDAPTGYANYTDQVVSQFATGSIDFAASFSSGTYGFNIYIDWNNNMAFEDSEKVYGSASYVSNASGTIVVPDGTPNGDYRMRIVSDWLNTNPPPCGGSTYAEAEDYTFSVIDQPSCMPPTYLVVSNITANSADISWTENGSATQWEITYGESGFDPATEGTTITDADGTPGTTLPGLSDNTEYDFYVRAICSTDDESFLAGSVSFFTLCLPTDVTYLMDFESATVPDLPNCTARENLGDGNEWVTQNLNDYGFNSNVLSYSYDFSNPANAWFYTQGINMTAGTDYQISYQYGNNSTFYAEKLKVSYGTGAEASAMVNELVDYPNISMAASTSDTIYFSVDADGVYYFGFNVYSDENEYYLYVDNIEIKVAAGCEAPSDVTVTNIDANSATVSWTETTTATEGYTVEVFTDGANPDTDTPVYTETVAAGTTTADVTGLDSLTTYDAYVTSNCGAQAIRSDVVTFTTSATGIGELEAYGFTYYPNPVKNIVNMSADTPIQDITVYNLLGKKVIRVNPESTTVSMDMSNLASGSYLVKVTINGSVSTYKLMKN